MIKLKNNKEIDILREGGHRLAKILNILTSRVSPGVNTAELEDLACRLIDEAGGEPAFKNYDLGGGLFFPNALCVSLNNEVVHGVATPGRILKNGDIVDLDIGMRWPKDNGLYTDTCQTVPVGKINKTTLTLLKMTKKALQKGIEAIKPGKTLNDVGKAIERVAKNNNYGVVVDYVGHGVGFKAHEDPNVFNYEIGDNSPENIVLKEGLVIAIEPMFNLGSYKVKTAKNGFTVITADNSLSAHFEHTVVVTKNGCEVLTKN